MSNVDRLHQAGIVNPDALTQDQKDFINKELTAEDVDDLIRVGSKFHDHCRRHQHSFGTFTWGI
jgi:hypothetical protein